MIDFLVIVGVALFVCFAVPVIIANAERWALVDTPNSRSMHQRPVPRGSGIALVVAAIISATVFWMLGRITWEVFGTTIVGALLVGGVGFGDDRSNLSIRIRLPVHFLASAIVIFGLFEVTSSQLPIALVLCVALAWLLNLYNFMDGIDGIALQQSVFLSLGSLIALGGLSSPWSLSLISIAVGSASLLYWNWSPARIFLGDVGSGFLGFYFGAVAVHSIILGESPVLIWPMLWGVFIVDTSITLTRRMLSGQQWLRPHRSHAYQKAAARLGSHSLVSTICFGINVLWLLPWVVAVQYGLVGQIAAAIVSLTPLFLAALLLGAGEREEA